MHISIAGPEPSPAPTCDVCDAAAAVTFVPTGDGTFARGLKKGQPSWDGTWRCPAHHTGPVTGEQPTLRCGYCGDLVAAADCRTLNDRPACTDCETPPR